MTVKRVFINLCNVGVSSEKNDEQNRRIFIVNLFSIVGLLASTIMGITALVNANYPLAFSLLSAAAVFLFGFTFQYLSGNTQLSAIIIVYALFILLVYLVTTGGVNNTGPLWIFMFAPVALYVHGLKRGLTDIILFLIAISVVMFYPDEALLSTSYSQEFKLRLIYSFLTITFLSSIYEYSRAKTFDHLVIISQKFEELAKIDPLTQISNRRDALEILQYEVDRSEREGEIVSIALCDLDYFKTINDKFGHEAGDQVLVSVAETLVDITRKQDTVARWGGEEFFLVFPRTVIQDAYTIAEKIRTAIAEKVHHYQSGNFKVTMSVGLCDINPGDNVEQKINLADKALYRAKASGRNCTEPKPHASLAVD